HIQLDPWVMVVNHESARCSCPKEPIACETRYVGKMILSNRDRARSVSRRLLLFIEPFNLLTPTSAIDREPRSITVLQQFDHLPALVTERKPIPVIVSHKDNRRCAIPLLAEGAKHFQRHADI